MEEVYYKKQLGGNKKWYKWQLEEIIDKIEMSNPKISSINCIGMPETYPSKKG